MIEPSFNFLQHCLWLIDLFINWEYTVKPIWNDPFGKTILQFAKILIYCSIPRIEIECVWKDHFSLTQRLVVLDGFHCTQIGKSDSYISLRHCHELLDAKCQICDRRTSSIGFYLVKEPILWWAQLVTSVLVFSVSDGTLEQQSTTYVPPPSSMLDNDDDENPYLPRANDSSPSDHELN